MQSIGKAQVIAKAWEDSIMGNIPKNKHEYPYWYSKRLEACDKCEHNSKNISLLKLKPKIWFQTLVMRKPTCELCGCCIREKTWMKSEICALAHEEGGKPKWNRIEMVTSGFEDFDVEIMNDEMNVDISEDGKRFVIDAYDVKIGEKIEVALRLHNRTPFNIEDVHFGCGCMGDSKYDKNSDENNDIYIRFTINTEDYVEGKFEKHLSVQGRYENEEKMFFYCPFMVTGTAFK